MASNLALPPLPDNFKPVGHLLKTASEHESRDAVVTYWARLAALQSAMVIDKKSKEAKAVLIPLMDWLEKEKKVCKYIFKGQVISESKLDVLNFPKNQRKILMNFCPRI